MFQYCPPRTLFLCDFSTHGFKYCLVLMTS
jgi:hypothetical protein